MGGNNRELLSLALRMSREVNVGGHDYYFRTYDQCFVGEEAVQWLVSSGTTNSVAGALALGNQLLAAGVIHHVTNEHAFQNKYLFYRFRWNDQQAPNFGQKVPADKMELSVLLRADLERRLATPSSEHSTSFKQSESPTWPTVVPKAPTGNSPFSAPMQYPPLPMPEDSAPNSSASVSPTAAKVPTSTDHLGFNPPLGRWEGAGGAETQGGLLSESVMPWVPAPVMPEGGGAPYLAADSPNNSVPFKPRLNRGRDMGFDDSLARWNNPQWR
mmetsp:Transcript_2881/g.6010  ORF Transcript_2881/g.6010 Transcript_2881/m.6010 type:complete len:271 (-) Transcript_2881:244-1056(-)